jgi:hypothetical protein
MMFAIFPILMFSLLAQPAQTPAPVTLLRSAVGPSGQVRNGDYALDEERARFDPARDKQVVVLFQWQGAPGVHRMSVQWKSPDGGASTTPPIEYAAPDRRFGGYWPLTLTAQTAQGTWSAEAIVDGQPAGRLTFDVRASDGTAAGAVSAAPVRRIMTQAQLFARLSAASVVLERSTSKGRRIDPAGAVALGHGRLVTAIAAVDGADSLVAVLPDGKRQPITSILGMNRTHDWIMLAGGPDGDLDQPVVSENTVQVGDRCFSIEAATGGTRILVDGAITGRAGSQSSGTRLVANLAAGTGMPGSPVFSEFGELIGFIGGALVPGVYDLADLIQFRAELKGAPVVPLPAAGPGASAVTFSDAWARGDILHALDGREHVISGGFAKGILKDQTVRPADQRQDFSTKDKEFVVFITWGPQARLKGMTTLRLYDQSNQLVADSKPAKLDVRPGSPSVLSSWKMSIPTRAGIYRADVLVDGVPMWRGFVRVTD